MGTDSDTNELSYLFEQLAAIVGNKHILTQGPDIGRYTRDWTGQYAGKALAVALPAQTSEVAAVVKLCADHSIAVVPQGGSTGLCGGGVPIEGRQSIIISLSRMNKIRELDVTSRTVIAEAGVVLDNLHNTSSKHGLVFPLMFGAKESCTLGGNLSTNAGGSNVLRYGNTRELCLGIEAVMADGSIINALTGLRKDNTGYDLKNLLIGAEGTLGIITAAVFKLFPAPLIRTTAFLSVSSIAAAIKVLNNIQDRTGGAVEAFEYMPRAVVNVICKTFPQLKSPLQDVAETGILLEVASIRPFDADQFEDGTVRLQNEVFDILAELIDSGDVLDASIAQSEKQRADLWRLRESTLEAITENGPSYHLDISLPLSKISAFISKMDATCERLCFQPLTIGHLGDGNLHYALSAGFGKDWAMLPLETAKERAFSILGELNGSFSAEHGVGQSKLSVMTLLKEPAQLDIMRAIKKALDPKNTMNPGKLLPEPL